VGELLLTEDSYNALVAAERKGLGRRSVAAMGGVSERTYWRWLERGKRACETEEDGGTPDALDEKYMKLWRETEKARAVWEQEALASMQDDDTGKVWQRDAWRLERRRPEDYSLVTVSRQEGGPQQVSITVVNNPEALEGLDAVLRKLAAPQSAREIPETIEGHAVEED
jgi:transposase